MKRRDFIAASAALPVIAEARTESPKTARYAIVISNAYERGAVVAFSLPDAVRKAREELGRREQIFDTGYLSCEVIYADGRDPIYIGESNLTKATLSETQARAEIIDNCRRGIEHSQSSKTAWIGPGPSERTIAEWKKIVEEGPSDEQVKEKILLDKRSWLSDEELAEYERKYIA